MEWQVEKENRETTGKRSPLNPFAFYLAMEGVHCEMQMQFCWSSGGACSTAVSVFFQLLYPGLTLALGK